MEAPDPREDAVKTKEEPERTIWLEADGWPVATRPTAVNPGWAVERATAALAPAAPGSRAEGAYALAGEICDEDVAINRAIGEHGLKLIRELGARNPGRAVEVLTHCNAGRLATVAWGTATAPLQLVLTGTDRTTAGGDVAKKIGTYLVALAARESGVPFYVAAPRRRSTWPSTSPRRDW